MATQPRRRSTRVLAQKTDWINVLPPELWERIGGRLPSGRDAANFRSMCTLWRDALPFTKFAPVLMLPFDPESPDGAVNFYRPTDGKVLSENLPALQGKVVCGSSHGWLALIDEAACLTLLNPFTNATTALPPTDDRRFAIHDWRLLVDGRWRCVHPSFSGSVVRDIKLGEMRGKFIGEIVLSSPADSGDCIAMALIRCSCEIAFCRVGVDASWRLLDTNLTHQIESIVHCRNRFLAICGAGQVSICNVAGATPMARKVQLMDLPSSFSPRAYLQVNGELHQVCTVKEGYTYRTRVYKCNVFARKPVWSRVKNAGDVTLLASHNFMAGHGGASVSGLKKNSIYFSIDFKEHLHRCKCNLNHGLEIINIADGTSEWHPYHQHTHGYPEALCWIIQNPWTQGGHSNA